jgi:N-acetylmuramoyl-L-alanine amidase
LLAALTCAAAWDVHAQTPAGERYQQLLEQDLLVSSSTAADARDFRVIIDRYWNFVRRYPSSGYADNAVWQAAHLASQAFERFSAARDQSRAMQLFQWLRDEYPHSPLVAKIPPDIGQLAAAPPAPGLSPPQTSPLPAASPTAEATLRAVRREVLPDVVRVTIELDGEVPFSPETLTDPARLFFDLRGTKADRTLVDAVLRYDSDIVRHIRLGRHPNNTTRVVLDLENVSRHSVFTLYNPYRVVIDLERTTAPQMATLIGETPGTRPALAAPASRIAPAAPAAPIAPIAPVARVAPIAPGKPLAPSANSSGKFSVARQLGLGISRVVIDAGHGGHDPGASAFGITESEFVLDVALRLEQLLLAQPGIEVNHAAHERLPSLEERTATANHNRRICSSRSMQCQRERFGAEWKPTPELCAQPLRGCGGTRERRVRENHEQPAGHHQGYAQQQ